MMNPGDKVDDFTLKNQDGKSVNLSDYKSSPVVLFFYPRADTPGCTIESCGFRDAFEKFQAARASSCSASPATTVKDSEEVQRQVRTPLRPPRRP